MSDGLCLRGFSGGAPHHLAPCVRIDVPAALLLSREVIRDESVHTYILNHLSNRAWGQK